MALFIYSVTIFILCLTMEVHSEMSGDVVFSLLKDRIENMEIKLYTIKNSINQRLDILESQIFLPSNTDIVKNTENADIQIPKKKADRILKALAAEKTLIRNMVNSFEGGLIAFQNTVGNQIKWMNKTLKTNNENMEREHEENTLALNNKITLLKEDLEMSTVKLERKLANKSLFINNSIIEFKSESERKLRDTIKMFENALNKTSTEHVEDYNKLQEMIDQIATNALVEVESVERQPTPTVSGTTTSIDTDRGTIKVGDKVRVKSSVDGPSHGWGSVTHDSIGTVSFISPDDENITVNFPEQASWYGVIDEMERV